MDKSQVVTIVVTVFGCTGFWQFVMWAVQNWLNKKSVAHKALLGVLQDRIFWLCNKYLDRGSISSEEMRTLLALYEPYIELGGNGVAKALKEEVDELPIINGRYT